MSTKFRPGSTPDSELVLEIDSPDVADDDFMFDK
jgi:hypothetical protein